MMPGKPQYSILLILAYWLTQILDFICLRKQYQYEKNNLDPTGWSFARRFFLL